MMSAQSDRWMPRLLTLLVWASVAASVTQWALRWGDASGTAANVAPVAGMAAPAPGVDSAAVARLLGGADAGANAVGSASAARLQLAGVVAASPSGRGAALITVDGKPAKAFAVGSRVEEGLYLLAVAPRKAQLGPTMGGPAAVTLDLPKR